MTLAYIFLAHTLPDQLARLVSVLHHDDDLFLIHIDAKIDESPFAAALHAKLGRRPNIEYIPRVRCDWAGFGHLEATLNGIDQALSRPDHTHVVLLTGQDYPIKPLKEIRAFLDANRGHSFLSWSAGDEPVSTVDRSGNRQWYWDGGMDRLERRHYLFGRHWIGLPNRFLPFLPRRRMPPGLRPYQGLAYWCLSREALEYARGATNDRLIRFFRRTLIADEFFFQTLLLASPMRPSLVNDDLRYISWDGWHPRTLRSSDLDDLGRSSKLFARKFDLRVDPKVLDLIDSVLLSTA